MVNRYGLPCDDAAGYDGYERRPFELYIEIQLWADEPITLFISIHVVGATAPAILALIVASHLAHLSNLFGPPAQALLILAAVASTAGAVLMWNAWSQPQHPSRRRHPVPAEPVP